jgi:ketosteroid isomerase-like protein
MLANAEAVVREYMAASEALDLERTLTLYSESIIWEDPGYGDGEGDYFTSKAEVKAMYGWFFALPDIHLDNTTYFISADGHRAAVEWVWTGTHNADTYTIRGVSVLEIEDGKIVHEVIYYDPTMAP